MFCQINTDGLGDLTSFSCRRSGGDKHVRKTVEEGEQFSDIGALVAAKRDYIVLKRPGKENSV